MVKAARRGRDGRRELADEREHGWLGRVRWDQEALARRARASLLCPGSVGGGCGGC